MNELPIFPWVIFAVGVTAVIITAYFLGIEVGIDRQKRKEEGKP